MEDSNDYSFIDGGVVQVFSSLIGLEDETIREIIFELEDFGYVNIITQGSEQGLQLLP